MQQRSAAAAATASVGAGPAAGRPRTVRVWDPLVRSFHWLVAAGFFLDYLLLAPGERPHEWLGYAVAAALAVRVAWGFVGTPHARFADFVPGPARLRAYLGALTRGREPRYVGHNPGGSVVMLSLMALLALVSVTGWMLTTDRFWGVSWVQSAHGLAADAIFGLAFFHVGGALVESVRHRENLVWAMVTGRKRAPSGTDVDHARSAG